MITFCFGRIFAQLPCIVLTSLLLVGVPAYSVKAEVTYRTVILEGDVAPGQGGATFYEFGGIPEGPVINRKGRVAFYARFSTGETGGRHDFGIWAEGEDGLTLKVKAGEVAPGTNDAIFEYVSDSFMFTNSGDVVFAGDLSGPGITDRNDFGFWSNKSGSIELIARKRDLAPGTGGAYFSRIGVRAFNGLGQVALHGYLTGQGVGPGNDVGIWSQAGDQLRLVVRSGDIAPGTGGKQYLGEGDPFNQVAMNSMGQIAFSGGAYDLSASTHTYGIWLESGGSMRPVVFRGESAPGTNGEVFSSFSRHFLTDSGELIIYAATRKPGYSYGDRYGIWREKAGEMELIAYTGDTAPGSAGRIYTGVGNPFVTADGQILAGASLDWDDLTDENRTALWVEQNGELKMLFRADRYPPGQETARFHAFDNLAINGKGQIAFTSGGPDEALWATDRDGALQLIAQVGEEFDVNDDPLVEELKTVAWIVPKRYRFDNIPMTFNDAGQLAFQLLFTDGSSGIFVANTIPEPTTIALVAVGGLVLMVRRRNRRMIDSKIAISRS